MLGAEPDVGVGGEVKSDVRAPHRGCQRWQIERIAANQREGRMCQRVFEKPLLTSREVIEGDDGVAVGKEAIDQSAPDETSSACDACAHEIWRGSYHAAQEQLGASAL